jgi:predicted porin
MKKSLFALAAVGAFAGAAQAQSSVTVYGILDTGLIGGSYRAANATIPKATGLEFGQGAESTTRLGFRGTEDLGGGARAFFTLEMALAMNGTNTLGSAGNSNRQSFVGLGKKGLGELSIGTQYTTAFELAAATSPGQLNNIVGDVVYGQQTVVATATSTANSLASQNASSGSDVGFTVRTANMLKLRSERMAGVQATAFYFMDNDNATRTVQTSASSTGYVGGNNNRNGWGVGLNYSLQKLYVGAQYQSLKAVNPYQGTTAGVAAGCLTATACTTGSVQVFGSSNNTGTNVQDNQFLGGATYDFGILKAYAQYVNRKVSSEINGNAYAKRTAQQIGVRGMFTKQVEGWASIGNGRYSTFGANSPTANFNGWQLGSNYILSKRTNLYAIYGQSITSSTSGSNNSAGVSNYAVGVRHTF